MSPESGKLVLDRMQRGRNLISAAQVALRLSTFSGATFSVAPAISWQEADGSTVVHIDDFEGGRSDTMANLRRHSDRYVTAPFRACQLDIRRYAVPRRACLALPRSRKAAAAALCRATDVREASSRL